MTNENPLHRYGKPGRLYLTPNFQEVQDKGRRLVAELSGGNATALPVGVTDFLTEHATTINYGEISSHRWLIAHEVEAAAPPYTEAFAQRVGGLLGETISLADQSALRITFTNDQVDGIWDNMGRSQS